MASYPTALQNKAGIAPMDTAIKTKDYTTANREWIFGREQKIL
jgi:hypothetical protein